MEQHSSSSPPDPMLNDIWTYRFHDPDNEDWTLQSYIRVHDVSTVRDFWQVQYAISPKLDNGMFFIMREHVFPCWDDEFNIHGGCLSIKVLKEKLPTYWETLSRRLLGETLLRPEHKDKWDIVNGISTSPKRFFCIVKIWLKSNELNDKSFFNLPNNYHGDIIYKENMDNIQKNHN